MSFNAPPLMPEYQQPPVSNPNYQWIPGYWAMGSGGYYWVPGTWMAAPQQGLLWTPGYWGYQQQKNNYAWNQGYWAPNVGYYGGINYGGGYYGNGYVGGAWQRNMFAYNTAVTPVNTQYIRNVYVNKTVIVRNVHRYSYNGPGGVRMYPDARQLAIAREHHVYMTPMQRAHIAEAAQDRNLYAKYNHGKPSETAVAHPLSTTNRPTNFKPLTPADKTAMKTTANSAMKPATQTAPKAHPKPVAQPQQSMKPAVKPPAQQHQAKPPTNTTPSSKQGSKPPTQQHQATKPASGQPNNKTSTKNAPQKAPQGKATHAPRL
ncbi:MAG: hypothetical protein ABI231_04590 [Candidatus Tumulicola sp.]